jgi:uncharacterized repeat protein (TIGR03803 family)
MKKNCYHIAFALLSLLAAMVFAVPSSNARTFRILHEFSGAADGATPYAGLTIDSAGNLYGTTEFGGNVDCKCGTLFKITPAGKFWVLHRFHGADDAKNPNSPPILDSLGNIYGTTFEGGTSREGAVYKISAGTETVLLSFGANMGSAGFVPVGVTLDPEGNLYGTTVLGGDPSCQFGSSGCGVIFKLNPSGEETVLHEFTNTPDGGEPFNGVIRDSEGNLYGTTRIGGNTTTCQSFGTGCGVVYKLDVNGNFQVLKAFNGADGKFPSGRLVMGKHGNLYGTTLNGGSAGFGVVFQLVENSDGSWKYKVLHEFDKNPAAGPTGTLLLDQFGTLWGTTGGVVDGASVISTPTVFKMLHHTNGTWEFKVVHQFIGEPALIPTGDLAVDTAGRIYGSTASCSAAAGCQGTVFRIVP